MEATSERRGRSPLAWAALIAALVSAIGIVILLVGVVFDVEGAREGEEGRAIFSVAWGAYFLGAIAALLTGLAAYFVGRSRGDADTQRAGQIALGWFGVALVIFVIAAVVS